MQATSLIAAHVSYKKHILDGLKDYGLKAKHPRILYYVSKHEGCQQKDIAEYCYVESATLSTVLANMEKRGLIERRAQDNDRRAYSIYPKEEARPVYEAVKRQMEDTERIAFAGFSDEEKKEMQDYLRRIEDNIRNSEKWSAVYPKNMRD